MTSLRPAQQAASSIDRPTLEIVVFAVSYDTEHSRETPRESHSGKLIKEIKLPETRRGVGTEVSEFEGPGANSVSLRSGRFAGTALRMSREPSLQATNHGRRRCFHCAAEAEKRLDRWGLLVVFQLRNVGAVEACPERELLLGQAGFFSRLPKNLPQHAASVLALARCVCGL